MTTTENKTNGTPAPTQEQALFNALLEVIKPIVASQTAEMRSEMDDISSDVGEKASTSDVESLVEEAVDGLDLDTRVSDALSEADLSDAVESAMDDYDLDSRIEQWFDYNVDMDDKVSDAISNIDMSDYIDNAAIAEEVDVAAAIEDSDTVTQLLRDVRALQKATPTKTSETTIVPADREALKLVVREVLVEWFQGVLNT